VTPITRTVLRVALVLRPEFVWRDSAHGQAMRWMLWVGDTENDFIYYNEVWTLTRKMMQACHPHPCAMVLFFWYRIYSCSRTTSHTEFTAALEPQVFFHQLLLKVPRTVQHSDANNVARIPPYWYLVDCRRRSTGSASQSQSLNRLQTTTTSA
jgi:activating signal cointegrator complex subunit 3